MLVRTTLSFCLCGGSEDKDNEAFCSISGMTKKMICTCSNLNQVFDMELDRNEPTTAFLFGK